jgi:uncharacterized protein YndB with AHSA1/START domain
MPPVNPPRSALCGQTRRQILMAAALAFGGAGIRTTVAAGAGAGGLSHSAEAIHQEPLVPGSPRLVYEALTDSKRFDKLMQFSAAMQSAATKPKPAEISPEEGGAFSLFGGYITGRSIELIPGELIVQAWRVGSWSPGVYSIVRFQLVAKGTGTQIIFDHTGFPAAQGEHLAEGWKSNYWDPLTKLLA